MHRRFYEQHRREAAFSPVVSAILLPQSYLSLEFVLQQRNILTEITYLVAAVTLKNTRLIENSLGTFSYRISAPAFITAFRLRRPMEFPMPRPPCPKPCSIIFTFARRRVIQALSVSIWRRSCALTWMSLPAGAAEFAVMSLPAAVEK